MLYENVLRMNECSFISTDGMTENQWLNLRTSGIGGSDAGALIGLNQYATPLSVYLSKKELNTFTGNKATARGHILEDPVRQYCKKELNIEIETVPGMFRNKSYEFMNANFDGLCYADNEIELNGTKLQGIGGHEIKTSSFGDGFTVDEIPDSYYCQVQHYMAVTGLEWFILSAYIISGDVVKHYAIKRDPNFIDKLISVETDFWENYVLMDKIPAPTGNEKEADLVDGLYKYTGNVVLSDEILPIVQQEREINQQIKELKTQDEKLKELIKLEVIKQSGTDEEKNAGCKCEVGNYKISWTSSTRKSVDSNKLKLDGLYDQYTKESVSHTLRITELKK